MINISVMSGAGDTMMEIRSLSSVSTQQVSVGPAEPDVANGGSKSWSSMSSIFT